MKQRPRIYYTESQRALMWERWQKGDTLHQIARLFDRHHPSAMRMQSGLFDAQPLHTIAHGAEGDA